MSFGRNKYGRLLVPTILITCRSTTNCKLQFSDQISVCQSITLPQQKNFRCSVKQPLFHFQRPPVPFVISFAGKLPHNVTSGTAEFVNLEDVPVKKDDDCLFGRAVPSMYKLPLIIHKCHMRYSTMLYCTIILADHSIPHNKTQTFFYVLISISVKNDYPV